MSFFPSFIGPLLTKRKVNEKQSASSDLNGSSVKNSGSARSVSDAPTSRIDDSPSPSIGLAAAHLLEVEPEKELWRNIARDWHAAGITEQPGTGKLHHHLGLLLREVEDKELRGVYHFFKRYFRIYFL
jgi:protein SMG6